MKAAVIDRFGGPEEIYYTDIEKPVPGPDEVLVRNVYIGVGKPDYIMRSGICPFLEAKPRLCGVYCCTAEVCDGISG